MLITDRVMHEETLLQAPISESHNDVGNMTDDNEVSRFL